MMKLIALEEYFVTPEVLHAWQTVEPQWWDSALKPSSEGDSGRRLPELGQIRFRAMDDAGIDVQVLSLTTPGVQNLAPESAIQLAHSANDYLAKVVRSRPDRFQGS